MRKNHLLSQTPEQGSLIEPPVKIDFAQLLAEAALSENGRIVKRRQSDIQRGRIAGRNEGIAQVQALAKEMAQEGKMTPELAEFLKRLEARDKPNDG